MTHSYYPSHKASLSSDLYKFVLLGDRAGMHEQLASGCYLKAEQPRVKPMTSETQDITRSGQNN